MSAGGFFLLPESISAEVQAATFERGPGVYRNQQVLEHTVHAANSREWGIEGSVQGSGREIYDTSVTVEVSPDIKVMYFSGACSCPVGHNCKHSVALALKAAYKTGGRQTAKPSPDQKAGPPADA